METHSVFLQVFDFREALILQVQLVVEGGCLELPILSALLSDPLFSHYQRHLFLSFVNFQVLLKLRSSFTLMSVSALDKNYY